ncbi:MAG: FHA domain-containing protein, partial [Myxococcota bacterium]
MCLEVLVKRDGQPYMRVALDRSPVIIGRDSSAGIRLESKKVSRNHARIEFDQDTVRIVDSGSRNGFRVDGRASERAELKPANTVILAGFEFRVRLTATPRSRPGEPVFFGNGSSQTDTADRGRLLGESRSRVQPPPTRAYDFADELSEGWAEIAREGREDTNIIRQPVERPARVGPELGFVERSVMNQLATARSFADVRSAVGDDSLDDEDADEYIRPDVEPLLATLHRETEGLMPGPGDRNVAVEVIFAIGASIEDTGLLAPGERYWWGGQPSAMEEAFLVPNANRFPIVTHLAGGVSLSVGSGSTGTSMAARWTRELARRAPSAVRLGR